jgi:Flp pilus assembly protein TadD
MDRAARIALTLCALAVGLLLLLPKIGCTDVWFHLRAGEWLLAGGGFPKADPFSFTADAPWIDTSLLFQVPLALVHRVAGLAGVGIANAIVLALAFGIVARSGRRRGVGAPELAAWTALALLACSPRLYPRPETLSLLYLAVALRLTDRALAGRTRALWGFVPLQFLWVNSETLFPLGLAVLGAGFIEALRRRAHARDWAIGLGGGLAASLVNPFGLRGALLPLKMARQVADPNDIFHRGVIELMSVFDRHIPFGSVVFFLALAGLVLAVAVRRRRRLDLFAILVLAGLGWLAARSVRNIPLFALAAPYLALRLGGVSPLPRRLLAPGRWALAGGFAFLAIGIATSSFYTVFHLGKRTGFGLDDRLFPTSTVATLRRDGAPARVMNDHALGHYLIWELRPGTKVFFDGRSEVYSPAALAAIQPAFAGAAAFDGFAERYGVSVALLGHRREYLDPLLAGLAAHPRWTVAGCDAAGVLLLRDAPSASAPEPAPPAPVAIPAPRSRGWLANWFAPAGRDEAENETATARALLLVGRPEGAATHALRAAQAAPGSADAFNALGAALLRLGRYDEGGDALRACLALDARYTEAMTNLGVGEIAAGRPAEAESWLRRALAAGAPEGDARFQLGRALAAQSRPAEARAELVQAIRLLPRNPKPALELASLVYHQGEYREAAGYYLEGARRGETFRGLWGAGVSYHAAGAAAEARDALTQALVAAPDEASRARVRELLGEIGPR